MIHDQNTVGSRMGDKAVFGDPWFERMGTDRFRSMKMQGETKMVIYVCEDCVDGIFTGVYNAWASRLGHANVALRVEGPTDLELFAEYRSVETDAQKAQKVADTIRRRMGETSYEMIYRAALANAPEKADCIYRVLAVGLSRHTDSRIARHLIEGLQDTNACRIFELSRKVQNEAHRYEGFVRFREIEGGVLFSEIEAENQILPLIGEHFSDRFPNEHFLIFDHCSGDCLVHAARQQWFIWRGAGKELPEYLEDRSGFSGRGAGRESCGKDPEKARRVEESADGIRKNEEQLSSERIEKIKYPAYSAAGLPPVSEEEIQRLWRGFCGSISIRERENLNLQRQFWPLKFRKWMTEGSGQESRL